MSSEPQVTVLAEGKLPDLKAIRRTLEQAGIDSDIIAPTNGCGSG